MFTFSFFFASIMLGIGLAMDAFSVSLANGLNEPNMKGGKMVLVAGIFSAFQFLMPLIGWFFVHAAATHFKAFEPFIPWIALALLLYIGIKMILDGVRCGECEECRAVGFGALIVQGIATSIDALSVGFTIATYSTLEALTSCLIIGVLTFAICMAGIFIGKKFGTALAGKASIFGGAILIFIGIEIFISGII